MLQLILFFLICFLHGLYPSPSPPPLFFVFYYFVIISCLFCFTLYIYMAARALISFMTCSGLKKLLVFSCLKHTSTIPIYSQNKNSEISNFKFQISNFKFQKIKNQKSEIRNQKSEIRNQKSDIRYQISTNHNNQQINKSTNQQINKSTNQKDLLDERVRVETGKRRESEEGGDRQCKGY